MRRNLSIAAIVLLAGLVLYLATRNPQAPFLPPDEDHAVWHGPDGCNDCHGAEGPLPRSRNHPIGNDCMRCHGRAD